MSAPIYHYDVYPSGGSSNNRSFADLAEAFAFAKQLLDLGVTVLIEPIVERKT